MNRRLLSASLVLTAAIAISGMTVKALTSPTTDSNQVQVHRDILITNSIESMAAKSPVIIKGVVSKELTSWNLARNPDDLTKEADEIRPGTDYEITSVQFLRGAGPSTITLTLPGGNYKGVTEERLFDIQLGKEYVLFLSPVGLGQNSYVLATAPGHFLVQGSMASPGAVLGVSHKVQALALPELQARIMRAPLAVPSKPESSPTPPASLPGHADANMR